MENSDDRLNRITARMLLGIIVLVALPYWFGAIILELQAIDTSSKPDALQLWQSAIFVQGLAIGIYGAAIALLAVSLRLRKLGLAGVLLGSACITFAMLVARVMDSCVISPLPFMLPSTLAISALVVGFNAVRKRRPNTDSESSSEVTEGQQPPQSQP